MTIGVCVLFGVTIEIALAVLSIVQFLRCALEWRIFMEKTMEKIVALAKARGFVYRGSEIYGGLANTWDYGNLGVELKNNVKSMVAKICSRKSL